MSNHKTDEIKEEDDLGIKKQQRKIQYIEDEATVQFLLQHTQREDIDFSQIKIPSYCEFEKIQINERKI